MTTICTDGRSMASDGRACRGDMIVASAVEKLVRLDDGSILGSSGSASVLPALANWLNGKGEIPENMGDWSALHLIGDAIRLYASKGGLSFGLLDPPAAIGSGGEIAIGAMLQGASPAEAIKAAMARDPFTGGKISALAPEPPSVNEKLPVFRAMLAERANEGQAND